MKISRKKSLEAIQEKCLRESRKSRKSPVGISKTISGIICERIPNVNLVGIIEGTPEAVSDEILEIYKGITREVNEDIIELLR